MLELGEAIGFWLAEPSADQELQKDDHGIDEYERHCSNKETVSFAHLLVIGMYASALLNTADSASVYNLNSTL